MATAMRPARRAFHRWPPPWVPGVDCLPPWPAKVGRWEDQRPRRFPRVTVPPPWSQLVRSSNVLCALTALLRIFCLCFLIFFSGLKVAAAPLPPMLPLLSWAVRLWKEIPPRRRQLVRCCPFLARRRGRGAESKPTDGNRRTH